MTLAVILALSLAASVFADLCEDADDLCPTECHSPTSMSFNAVAWVQPDGGLRHDVLRLDRDLYSLGAVTSIVPPFLLHMTILYFCCQARDSVQPIMEALRSLSWEALDVRFDSFGCNLDHRGRKVYLHSRPTEQDELWGLHSRLEERLEQRGVRRTHNRTVPFHSTLAHVRPDFDLEDASLLDWDLGTFRLDRFAVFVPRLRYWEVFPSAGSLKGTETQNKSYDAASRHTRNSRSP